jgi:hypothetical protein
VVVVKISKEWAQRGTMVMVALLASFATFVGVSLLLPPLPPQAPPPPSPPVRALQEELRGLRARVKELETTLGHYREAEAAIKSKKTALRVTAPALAASSPGPVPVPSTDTPTRFQRHLSAFRSERRNESWARAQERALRTLDEIRYFKNSGLAEVECRASTCRVLATHESERARSDFQGILVGFMPQLPEMLTRNADAGEKLRTEVLLSREPLP